jgi:hypothetical protein
MALSMATKIAIGVGVAATVAAVAGGSKSAPKVNAVLGTAPPPPPPPAQQGSSPHPSKPDDPEAGRTFTGMGVLTGAGEKTTHERAILKLAPSAKGEVLIDVWETTEGGGLQGRCTASRYVLTITSGRVFSTKVLTPDTICAGAQGPSQVGFSRTIKFVSRGPDVTAIWSAVGKVGVDENIGGSTGLEGFDPEDSPALFVYLDAQWQLL